MVAAGLLAQPVLLLIDTAKQQAQDNVYLKWLLCDPVLTGLHNWNIRNGYHAQYGLTRASQGITKYMNNPYYLGWSGKGAAGKKLMEGDKLRPSKVCKEKSGTLVKLTTTGNTPSEKSGNYRYVPVGDITDDFFKTNKWYETSTAKNIAAIKGNIFQYGPLPISVKLKKILYLSREIW